MFLNGPPLILTLLVFQHQPESVDYSRYSAEKRKNEVDPEVCAEPDLKEGGYRWNKNGADDFDDFHVFYLRKISMKG